MNGSGVDLLIASGTPHDRFLVQLCGRVGRYGQPCERFMLKGITERISEQEERDMRTAVNNRIAELKRFARHEESKSQTNDQTKGSSKGRKC